MVVDVDMVKMKCFIADANHPLDLYAIVQIVLSFFFQKQQNRKFIQCLEAITKWF